MRSNKKEFKKVMRKHPRMRPSNSKSTKLGRMRVARCKSANKVHPVRRGKSRS